MKVKIQGKTKDFRTVWFEKHVVKLIEQRKLPFKFKIFSCRNYKETTQAITDMVVRGAPAIGATAGYATAQAALEFKGTDSDKFAEHMANACEFIKQARPTAVDLKHAVDRVHKSVRGWKKIDLCKEIAVDEAKKIADEYIDVCKKIGEYGNELIKDKDKILTHCNAGALATVDYGTALAPMRFAHSNGKRIFVFVDETRPRMQGARLTAWELAQEGIEHAIIADNAVGYYMKKGEIDLCIVGADRIAKNGDVANKIGTYEKAVLAKENNIPFYVAAPLTTFDLELESGEEIPIEERSEEEVTHMWGKEGKIRVANEKSPAKNPAFDVTSAELITSFITEKGVIKAKDISSL